MSEQGVTPEMVKSSFFPGGDDRLVVRDVGYMEIPHTCTPFGFSGYWEYDFFRLSDYFQFIVDFCNKKRSSEPEYISIVLGLAGINKK